MDPEFIEYTPAPSRSSLLPRQIYPPPDPATETNAARSTNRPIDQMQYHSTNTIAQPPPPYFHVHQQPPQTAPRNIPMVATAQQCTTIAFAAARPPSYIALSWMTTLCCCFPIGFMALFYSLKVNSECDAGNFQEARRASNTARCLNIVGVVVGCILVVCGMVYTVVSLTVVPQ